MFTAYSIAAAVSSFVGGPIIEQIGYKRSIGFGMTFFFFGLTATIFVPFFWLIICSQIIAGSGSAFFGSATIAFAGEYFPEKKKTTAIGIIMSSFYIANITTVPLNAYVADLINWHWGLGILAIFCLIIIVLIFIIVPETNNRKKTNQKISLVENIEDNDQEEEDEEEEEEEKESSRSEIKEIFRTNYNDYLQQLKQILKNKYALGVFIITLFQRGGIFAMNTIVSSWLAKEYQFNNTQSGLVFLGIGIAAFLSNSLFSWIADRTRKKKWIILLGTGLTGLAVLLFPFLSFNAYWAVAGIIIANLCSAISMGSYNTYVTEVSTTVKGATVAINNTFGQIGLAAAVAVIGTLIYDTTNNYAYCGIAAAGMYTICFILMGFLIKKSRTPDGKEK
jgi:predicted MFS family arabinose efflux permease